MGVNTDSDAQLSVIKTKKNKEITSFVVGLGDPIDDLIIKEFIDKAVKYLSEGFDDMTNKEIKWLENYAINSEEFGKVVQLASPNVNNSFWQARWGVDHEDSFDL